MTIEELNKQIVLSEQFSDSERERVLSMMQKVYENEIVGEFNRKSSPFKLYQKFRDKLKGEKERALLVLDLAWETKIKPYIPYVDREPENLYLDLRSGLEVNL